MSKQYKTVEIDTPFGPLEMTIEYGYTPPEPQTHDHPGYDAEYELHEVQVQLTLEQHEKLRTWLREEAEHG